MDMYKNTHKLNDPIYYYINILNIIVYQLFTFIKIIYFNKLIHSLVHSSFQNI